MPRRSRHRGWDRAWTVCFDCAARPARNRQRHRHRRLVARAKRRCWPSATTRAPSRRARRGARPGCSGTAGLVERPDVPLFAQIGRLDPQKGWDLLAEVAEPLLEQDVQLVVLGDGHPRYHALIEDLARRHPGKFWAHLGFSDDLAHQIEAGADHLSDAQPVRAVRAEPALQPGTRRPCRSSERPVVWPTPWSTRPRKPSPTERRPGLFSREPSATALWETIERALALWPDRAAWLKLMQTGMNADWSWERSAREYVALYQEICRKVSSREPCAGFEPNRRACRRPRRERLKFVEGCSEHITGLTYLLEKRGLRNSGPTRSRGVDRRREFTGGGSRGASSLRARDPSVARGGARRSVLRKKGE